MAVHTLIIVALATLISSFFCSDHATGGQGDKDPKSCARYGLRRLFKPTPPPLTSAQKERIQELEQFNARSRDRYEAEQTPERQKLPFKEQTPMLGHLARSIHYYRSMARVIRKSDPDKAVKLNSYADIYEAEFEKHGLDWRKYLD